MMQKDTSPPFEYMQLYISDNDHVAKVGLGWRYFLVLERGRKWATLLYIPAVTKFRVPLEYLERAKPQETTKTALLKRLAAAVKYRQSLGMPISDSGATMARAILNSTTG